jgi:2'-5' RNA ligase
MSASIVPTRRLFFSLWPDDALRAGLNRAVGAVQAGNGRIVSASTFHLTLVFMGNVPVTKRPEIDAIASAIRIPPFRLCLDRYGYFEGPRVTWLGPSVTPEPLAELYALLFGGLRDAGLTVEERVYRPHVTLVRSSPPPPRQVLDPPLEWQVSEFLLVESRILVQGALYRLLRTWKLG